MSKFSLHYRKHFRSIAGADHLPSLTRKIKSDNAIKVGKPRVKFTRVRESFAAIYIAGRNDTRFSLNSNLLYSKS